MFKIQELDKTDIQLLNILQSNPDYRNKQIAGLLNKSETAIYDRIRSLKQKGFIAAAFILNSNKIENILTAFTQVQLKDHSAGVLDIFQETVTAYAEVMECYHMTGRYDFKLKIVVPDMPAYNNFLRTRLSAIPNVGAIESYFIIAEHKHEINFKVI